MDPRFTYNQKDLISVDTITISYMNLSTTVDNTNLTLNNAFKLMKDLKSVKPQLYLIFNGISSNTTLFTNKSVIHCKFRSLEDHKGITQTQIHYAASPLFKALILGVRVHKDGLHISPPGYLQEHLATAL